VQLNVASYNIRKAIGIDRRRKPDRIISVLRELDADVIALQEADRRFGRRESALPLAAILEHTPYQPVPVALRRGSMGWHGNALLVKRGMEILDASALELPIIEPRGAICADVLVRGQRVRIAGMHLDLSGLRRSEQVRHVLSHVTDCPPGLPSVLMGDFNIWTSRSGCMRDVGSDWQLLETGNSFPSRRPVAGLDRIVVSHQWQVIDASPHHSALASQASDHLPVKAILNLPKN
jgi:endonuclease/exonuclease/phosphatase family metal-dependent hydrolase